MQWAIRVIVLGGLVGGFAGSLHAQDKLEQTMTMLPVAEEAGSVERADSFASRESASTASESDMQRINLLEGEILARSSEAVENASAERDDMDTLDVIRNNAISDLAEINAISAVTGLLDGLLGDLLGSLL